MKTLLSSQSPYTYSTTTLSSHFTSTPTLSIHDTSSIQPKNYPNTIHHTFYHRLCKPYSPLSPTSPISSNHLSPKIPTNHQQHSTSPLLPFHQDTSSSPIKNHSFSYHTPQFPQNLPLPPLRQNHITPTTLSITSPIPLPTSQPILPPITNSAFSPFPYSQKLLPYIQNYIIPLLSPPFLTPSQSPIHSSSPKTSHSPKTEFHLNLKAIKPKSHLHHQIRLQKTSTSKKPN